MIKRVAFLVFALVGIQTVTAQVVVRNDFVINRKEHKIRNKGITSLIINLDKQFNFNFLMSGASGSGALRVDVDAIRHPRKVYSYEELAEKVYVPAAGMPFKPVPLFLLLSPPAKNIQLFPLPPRRLFFSKL